MRVENYTTHPPYKAKKILTTVNEKRARRRASPESSQPATPAAIATEIVNLALDSSATAAAVSEAQRPSLG